jgi:putative DNA primase/helicase
VAATRPRNDITCKAIGDLGDLGDLGQVGCSTGVAMSKFKPILVNLNDIEAKEVEWIWPGWILRGYVSLVTGDPGIGKTSVLLSIAAALAGGTKLPDGTTARVGRVLYLDGENGADEIKRRLAANGFTAFDNLRLLVNVGVGNNIEPFYLEKHLSSLIEAIKTFRPDWVIIDPIVTFHSRNEIVTTEVRKLLNLLAGISQKFQLAVTIVQHPNKAIKAPNLYRVRGSLDFVAAARAVLNVTLLQDLQDGTAALVMEKLNLAVKPEPLGFRIIDKRVEWSGPVQLPASQSQEKRAIEFLRGLLADGPVLAENVYSGAKKAGISEHTVQRAKPKLGIISRKRNTNGPWEWMLPPKM